MIAGPLCLGGKVGGGEEAMGSRETVFTFPHPSPAEARGSAQAEQGAGGAASAEQFPVDKIKDAHVTVLGRGRHRVLGSSNCLLLLSLQAYWWHFNPVETRIAPPSIFCSDFSIQLSTSPQRFHAYNVPYNPHRRACKADRVEN